VIALRLEQARTLASTRGSQACRALESIYLRDECG